MPPTSSAGSDLPVAPFEDDLQLVGVGEAVFRGERRLVCAVDRVVKPVLLRLAGGRACAPRAAHSRGPVRGYGHVAVPPKNQFLPSNRDRRFHNALPFL